MTKNTVPRCRVNPTRQPASPKYCIFGAGAIGGTIAAQLARANATVSIIDRDETVAGIQKDGLRLLINGETLQTAVRASADPAERGPQDYVIIAVKAPALPEAASRIGPLLGRETAVIIAMNGVPWWFFTNARGVFAGKRLIAPIRQARDLISSCD
jgi:2-dehydropantoate 2-reductase